MDKMNSLKELLSRSEKALAGDGSLGAEDQHKAGKLTARERVNMLLDEASFVELGRFFEQTSTTPGYECISAPGEGVVTGYGTIDGRPVYLFAQDTAVLSGSMSRGHAEKICKLMDMALRNGSPVIGFLDSSGARVTEGAAAMGAYSAVIKKYSELSGVVPTVAVLAGPSICAASVLPCIADFSVSIEGVSNITLHGPQIEAAALPQTAEPKSRAAAICNRGIGQFYAANEAQAFAIIRRLLSFLPQNNLEDALSLECTDDLNRLIPVLDTDEHTDTKEIITQVADNGDFMEVSAAYGLNIITGFIRLNGNTVGVVANANGESLDADACKKAVRFISMLDAYHLPILTLADCPDIPRGVQEPQMILALSALVYAYSQASSPLVTVVAGRAVGAGLLAMCPKSCGADIVYAWSNAVISALPVETGALIVFDGDIRAADDPVTAREEAIRKYADETANAFESARQGVADDVIAPSATRQMVIAAFEACASKRLSAKQPKKHGIWPL